MATHKAHEPLDSQQRNHKGNQATNTHNCSLVYAKAAALKEELHKLKRARTKHNGDSQKERKLRSNRARAAQKQAANDGGARARGARNKRKHLEAAYAQSGLPRKLVECCNLAKVQIVLAISCGGGSKMATSRTSTRQNVHGLALTSTARLNHNKGNAVDNQRNCYHGSIVEMLFHPVVQRQTNGSSRDAAQDNLAPKLPRICAALLALGRREGIELVEEQHTDRQNGAQLDNHEKHVQKRVRHVELNKLINQNHVAGRRDGQPLRNALDQTKERRF